MLEWFILHDGGGGMSQFKWGSAPKKHNLERKGKERKKKGQKETTKE